MFIRPTSKAHILRHLPAAIGPGTQLFDDDEHDGDVGTNAEVVGDEAAPEGERTLGSNHVEAYVNDRDAGGALRHHTGAQHVPR